MSSPAGRSRPTPRTAFWLAFAIFAVLGGLTALASPLASGPDEASHVAKAAGVARGHLIGSEHTPGVHSLALPRLYEVHYTLNDCFGLKPDVPASCAPDVSGDLTSVVDSRTTAGRYNPVYYVAIAAPTLMTADVSVLYLTRLASALLCAALLALAVRTLAEIRDPAWVVAGTAVAITPMVVYLSGVVNPASVEAAAGVALWVVLTATLLDPDRALLRRRMLRAGVMVLALVNAKALSPLLLALIVLLVVLFAGWARTRRTLLDRRAWPGLILGVLGALVAVLWIGVAGTVADTGEEPWASLTTAAAADLVVRRTATYLMNIVGVFGTADAVMPLWAYFVFAALAGVVVLLALALGARRERLTLVLVAGSVLVLPAALQLPQVATLGLPWQGRYLLPLAAGLPILAGFALRGHAPLPREATRRVVSSVVVGMAFLHLVGFGTNLRRHVAGESAGYFEPVPDAWQPPVPSLVLVVAAVITLVALVVLLMAVVGDPRRESGSRSGAAAAPPAPTDPVLPSGGTRPGEVEGP